MTKLKAPSSTVTPQRSSSFKKHITGSVSEIIGTGRPAQESIVWLTIRWSFSLGLILTVFLAITSLIHEGAGAKKPVEEIKAVWSIFVPIITLALGYIFGRNE